MRDIIVHCRFILPESDTMLSESIYVEPLHTPLCIRSLLHLSFEVRDFIVLKSLMFSVL